MTGTVSEHIEACNKYANDVVSGTVPACKWVRLTCERHLNDLKRDDWVYVFDHAKASRVCRFAELLPHVKGKWASKRELMRLEPWQTFLLCSAFGWINQETGNRRFRKLVWLIPRKNGKSFLAACVALYMLTMDGEAGAEVYSGATSEAQAWEVFGPAKRIADRLPKFRKKFGVEVNAKSVIIPSTGSKFVPIIGKPGDGSSPHCAIHDEYHEHDTDDQVGTMETGMGAREQPLQLIVTTAGSNLSGPCYQTVIDCRKVLSGAYRQEDLFYIEYTIDNEDDWATPESLRKANPNFGVSISEEFLLSKLEEAKRSARKQGRFQTKHLNKWVGSQSAFFNIKDWNNCADRNLKLEDYAGRDCYVGLDLATRHDIVSRVLLFPPRNDSEKWALFHYGYLPEDRILEAENEHYAQWHKEGWLIATEGPTTDHRRVRDDILKDYETFQLREMCYDPAQANIMAAELDAAGITVVQVRPIVMNFSEPMKDLDALITEGKITHNGDPVFTWMLSNVVSREDRKENVYPVKEKPSNKIDGPVAAIIAMNRARHMKPRRVSIYNESVL